MMKNGNERFSIRLRINNQEYPITVRRDEEEIYRAAERRINERLNLYRRHYPNLAEERYMFMAMIDLTTKLLENERRNDAQPYLDVMETITSEAEKALEL